MIEKLPQLRNERGHRDAEGGDDDRPDQQQREALELPAVIDRRSIVQGRAWQYRSCVGSHRNRIDRCRSGRSRWKRSRLRRCRPWSARRRRSRLQMRPLAKTSTRSQISASCSASELAQITDMPSAAALRSAAKICWRVPTSTPCVGSSSSSSEGDAVHPARDQHLLRIAAGQRRELQRRDRWAAPRRRRRASAPRGASRRCACGRPEEAADVGQEHVVDDRQAVDAAGALPVGGQQREAQVDRGTRVEVGLRHDPAAPSMAIVAASARCVRRRPDRAFPRSPSRSGRSGQGSRRVATCRSDGSSILPARLLKRTIDRASAARPRLSRRRRRRGCARRSSRRSSHGVASRRVKLAGHLAVAQHGDRGR